VKWSTYVEVHVDQGLVVVLEPTRDHAAQRAALAGTAAVVDGAACNSGALVVSRCYYSGGVVEREAIRMESPTLKRKLRRKSSRGSLLLDLPLIHSEMMLLMIPLLPELLLVVPLLAVPLVIAPLLTGTLATEALWAGALLTATLLTAALPTAALLNPTLAAVLLAVRLGGVPLVTEVLTRLALTITGTATAPVARPRREAAANSGQRDSSGMHVDAYLHCVASARDRRCGGIEEGVVRVDKKRVMLRMRV
jgi:hypothetical protein